VTIPDPIAELVALLQADPDVSALTGANVFGGELTREAKQAMPIAAVVVAPSGGPGRRGYLRVRRGRIDTICYGESLKQCSDLHAAVREVLENIRRSGSILWAQTIADGTARREPHTEWPICFASYQVMSATDAD
jgi:hypothetical protein